MLDTLTEMFLTDEQKPNYAIDSQYLSEVFPDFFRVLVQFVSMYTVTVNEYAYLCIFLYPHYMELVYKEHAKQLTAQTKQERAQIESNIKQIIDHRGAKLSTRQFRDLVRECLSNLYIHATSKEDILRDVEERHQDS